ncbi:MAG: succinylglutamate desuccinylase/aspartoacylase family protein [Candidatus Nanohaloarchaea archaeon]|nr:succinylglutamate desuccinylase/aspartoacylase family protein [Candidatus Nanohaloarchaea archaeon]
MRVETRGPGQPEIAIITLVHGDEVCGKEAVDRLLEEDRDFQKGVKFVYANEEAYEKGQRYVDSDLNRVAPGDPNSSDHEEQLAAELLKEVVGTTVLDLHSTVSSDVPFAIFSNPTGPVADVVRATGLEYTVDNSLLDGALDAYYNGTCVECGRKGTKQAAENAYDVITTFLRNLGALEGDAERSDPVVFNVFDQVDRLDGMEFVGTNFEKVSPGESFATIEGDEITAEETFYPVLMSNKGYENILGFKAEKLGRTSEL